MKLVFTKLKLEFKMLKLVFKTSKLPCPALSLQGLGWIPHKKSLIGHVRIGKLRFKSTMFLRTIVVVGMQCSGAPSG